MRSSRSGETIGKRVPRLQAEVPRDPPRELLVQPDPCAAFSHQGLVGAKDRRSRGDQRDHSCAEVGQEAPPCYGPRRPCTTPFAGPRRGVWGGAFGVWRRRAARPAAVLLDSSVVKAHRCASGGKAERSQAIDRSQRWSDDKDPRLERWHRPALAVRAGAKAKPPTAGQPNVSSPKPRGAPWCMPTKATTTIGCTPDRGRRRRPEHPAEVGLASFIPGPRPFISQG